MDLKTMLEKEARVAGAAYFGIADLSPARQGEITAYERKLMAQYPLAVSIGVSLLDGIVDGIEVQGDSNALKNYWFHVYEVINPLINSIGIRISHIIEGRGYRALQVPASHTVDTANLCGLFSHKIGANLAGLGWIGKSCLLVTPDRGTRVRWGTVLTDAPLEPDKPFSGKGCGSCTLCVDNCPVGAFTGKHFSPSEPREARMDASKCSRYLFQEQKRKAGAEACGMCVNICPFGRKK
ncbi:MAG: epoxyqueuosine reductase [Chloroflexi bacterium]|nr:epoxyqueuosine reductase [Chloroflexota bacterium]MBM3174713.1 epoxyqueuosine reductase [Chloroflexota bacterium]MBM4449800.1 epoxyqueuosine reductase [Chloroflexota bacterium]